MCREWDTITMPLCLKWHRKTCSTSLIGRSDAFYAEAVLLTASCTFLLEILYTQCQTEQEYTGQRSHMSQVVGNKFSPRSNGAPFSYSIFPYTIEEVML